MNIVDILIILFILLGAVVGFKQGFTKSLVSFLGIPACSQIRSERRHHCRLAARHVRKTVTGKAAGGPFPVHEQYAAAADAANGRGSAVPRVPA